LWLEAGVFVTGEADGEVGLDGLLTERFAGVAVEAGGDIYGDDGGIRIFILRIDPVDDARDGFAGRGGDSCAEESIDDEEWLLVEVVDIEELVECFVR